MSSPPAGWYANPEDSTQLRYWDGSEWTDHTAPAQQPGPPPPVSMAPQMTTNIYDGGVNLMQALDDEQRRAYMQHSLKRYPTWLAIVLHILTFGLFTLIYQGLKFSKLPLAKHDDFTAGKGIGFMFIPFFNIYWIFRYVLSLTDRLNFQFRLRGQHPPISRDLALASAIVQLIPYINILGFLILQPIVLGQWQSATNRLVAESQPAMAPPPPPAEADSSESA